MWTVLGGSGFIGRHVLAYLQMRGNCTVFAPTRNELASLKNKFLGHVIYCIGVTSDFRFNVDQTFFAHITLLQDLIRNNEVDSVVYLSSTRLYQGQKDTSENSNILISSVEKDNTYAISKLAGESFLLHCGIPAKIARLSNVFGIKTVDFGSGNFLDSVLTDAAVDGRVRFRTSPSSSKDFIHIDDVVRLLISLAESQCSGIFNIASGRNISNAEIAKFLESEGIRTDFVEGAPEWIFENINIKKIIHSFGAPSNDLMRSLPELFEQYRRRYAVIRGHDNG